MRRWEEECHRERSRIQNYCPGRESREEEKGLELKNNRNFPFLMLLAAISKDLPPSLA